MIIVLVAYLIIVWVLFSKLKLIKWSLTSGLIVVFIGVGILSVFMALLNTLTPAGRFVVVGRVVEVTPNVAGEVVSIPIETNVFVKAGSILFQIDPAPYEQKVRQLEATLVQAQSQARQLQSNHDQAVENVDGLKLQYDYHSKRLSDIQKLVVGGAQGEFRLQDTQAQFDGVRTQYQAAQAAEASVRFALESQVNGINSNVAQIAAQLDNARWSLEQTTIRAPADGYVSLMSLTVGTRALTARSVLSSIVANEVVIVGMFPLNGFQSIKDGAQARLIFDSTPGQIFETHVSVIPLGVGQGQAAVSGQLARAGSVSGVAAYPAIISLPQAIDPTKLRLGAGGTAFVISEKAGPIAIIASLLAWVSAYSAYL